MWLAQPFGLLSHVAQPCGLLTHVASLLSHVTFSTWLAQPNMAWLAMGVHPASHRQYIYIYMLMGPFTQPWPSNMRCEAGWLSQYVCTNGSHISGLSALHVHVLCLVHSMRAWMHAYGEHT